MEIFTGFKSTFDFSKFHTFGSPAYVLVPILQTGNKIPRSDPRSKLGVCLGKNTEHIGNDSLTLDPITGFVSPQFDFTSILRKRIDILSPNWDKLFKHYDKTNDDDLLNTLLTAAITNEGDQVVKVNMRFDHNAVFIRPNDDPLATASVSEDNSVSDNNVTSVDLEKDLNNALKYDYEHETNNEVASTINSKQEVTTT